MNDLFGRPWEERGYADIVGASIGDDELRVEFANGDLVVIPVGRLGLSGPSGVDVDREDRLRVRVDTGEGSVDVSWTQIRAASDPAFAQEMRRRDSEEARRIGLRLKALREDKGISQRHLAEQVAMPPAQLAKIERGTFDLRLSTVKSLLRAMGASLVDIAGRDVPEVSMREVGRRARAAGVPEEVVDRILAAVRRSEATTAIAQAFGWDPSAILAGSPTNPRLVTAVQFKAGDPETATGSPLLTMAYRVSEWITQAANLTNNIRVRVPIDARELRSAALDGAGHLTLISLLQWAWAAGMPVVPILGRGAFAAASWSVAQRPVIVLKDSRPFAAFWLFDLAHELGHIARGHVRESGVVDIDSPAPARSSDSQEEEANQFALELLVPRHRELLAAIRQDARGQYMRFKFSVQRVAQRAGVSEGVLGMVAAYELTEIGEYRDRWGSASNLARPEGAGRGIVQQILREHVEIERLPEIEREIITAVVLSG